MKLIKSIIFLVTLIVMSSQAFCQTKMIAHKSHSGKAKTFSIKGNDNFGLPSHQKTIDSIIKISQKKIIVISHNYGIERDTMEITAHPYFKDSKLSFDSIKKAHPTVKFIGFKEKTRGSAHNPKH